jgi:hypothetical protein
MLLHRSAGIEHHTFYILNTTGRRIVDDHKKIIRLFVIIEISQCGKPTDRFRRMRPIWGRRQADESYAYLKNASVRHY